MERSISNRFYFDYNATSPLSNKVIDFIKSGDFLFGNPSSLHTTGKRAKSYINQTKEYLFKTFNLNESEFDILFNSGASEAINVFFRGNALMHFGLKKRLSFYFSTVDHQAVISLADDLKLLGHSVNFFSVDSNGDFNLDDLIKNIKADEALGLKVFLNYTNVNNETGVVWSLDLALKIKLETQAIIHVDAVQLVGKIENWMELNSSLNAYSFSAHKFGGLKGVGFTFLKKGTPFHSIISGGNQQNGLRAGTENTLGIYTIKLALEEMILNFNYKEVLESKKMIEDYLSEKYTSKVIIVSKKAGIRNTNTLFVIIPGHSAESLSIKFDMAKIDLSTGSACSSGIIKENRILISMGFSLVDAKSCIRFSFSPLMKKTEAKEYCQLIASVLNSIL